MKIVVVAGSRPNFMKVAPLLAELRQYPAEFTPLLVHTGQHYDYQMSDVFFKDLELAEPDYYLDARKDSEAIQTADIIEKFDQVLLDEAPDLVVVVGDVTSTAACALVAGKRHVPLAHVEAGLRSGDRRMPEELNRLVTDALADILFTFSADADANLRAENVPERCIFCVGNLMIDTLLRFRAKAGESHILEEAGVEPGAYALATLHRAANVDNAAELDGILRAFEWVQQRLPIVFSIHPRTRKNIEAFGLQDLLDSMANVRTLGPLGYLDMVRLQEAARFALSDSAGIQEETTVLGVPCLTLRPNTERPVTVEQGTNQIVGTKTEDIAAAAAALLDGPAPAGKVPELWDGRSAARLVDVLRQGIVRR